MNPNSIDSPIADTAAFSPRVMSLSTVSAERGRSSSGGSYGFRFDSRLDTKLQSVQ